jgi:hypothetical protein
MSNAERQRNFQARHPGYDARRKGRQRSAVKAYMARMMAERQAAIAAAAAEQQALAEAAAASVHPTVPLALPVMNALAPTTERVGERIAA